MEAKYTLGDAGRHARDPDNTVCGLWTAGWVNVNASTGVLGHATR